MFESIYSSHEKMLIRITLFVFRVTLDYMYMYMLQKEYDNILMLSLGYSRGAFTFSTTPSRTIVSYLLTLLIIEMVVRFIIRNDKAHELICVGLLAVSVLPNLTMFSYSEIEWKFLLFFTIFWTSFFIFVYLFTKKIPLNNIEGINMKFYFLFSKKTAQFMFWIIALLFIVGSIILSYTFYGGLYINLSFSQDEVYAARLSARGAFGVITNYFRNNSMYIVVPILTNVFLIKKKYGLFAISFFVLLLLFSVDSQKAVLMLAFISMIGSLVIKRKALRTLVKGLLAINIFVIIFYLITGNILLIDYLVKRIYFLPAIIGKCYYEYVDSNGNLIFLSSFLQNINITTNYVYRELPLPYLVGRYYFGSSSISANTGGFAGAYAYGTIGMIIVPVFYGYLFKLLDQFTSNIDVKYYFPFIMVSVFVIEGTTLPSVLLVYGFIIGLFILYLMNNCEIFEGDRLNKIKFSFWGEK